MSSWWPLAAAALVGVTARAEDAPPELSAVLRKVGDQLAPASSTPCSFVEATTIEELDSDRKVKASEIHTYRVTRTPQDMKRTPVSMKKVVGSLSSLLRPKPDSELSEEDKKRRRTYRTPFHLEEQPKYRFKWAGAPQNGRGAIAYEPLKRAVEKGVGSATVELDSGRLVSMTSKPSEMPMYLSEMDARMSYADTACGLQATRFELTGEGGLLFVRMRFHTVTVLDGYSAPSAGQP